MGRFTVEKWKCDRCGLVEDKRPSSTSYSTIEAGYFYNEGPGPSVHWREMCTECNRKMERIIDQLIKDRDDGNSNN